MSLILTGGFMSLKSNLSADISSIFLIFAGLWSAGCEHLTKHHFNSNNDGLFDFLRAFFTGWGS